MRKPRKLTENEIQAFYSQLSEVQARVAEQGAQLEALQAETAWTRRLFALMGELWQKGPNIKFVGPDLTGTIPASQALTLFKMGYQHAFVHFMQALKGNFGGLEAVLNEEILQWEVPSPELEEIWNEDGPEC